MVRLRPPQEMLECFRKGETEPRSLMTCLSIDQITSRLCATMRPFRGILVPASLLLT